MSRWETITTKVCILQFYVLFVENRNCLLLSLVPSNISFLMQETWEMKTQVKRRRGIRRIMVSQLSHCFPLHYARRSFRSLISWMIQQFPTMGTLYMRWHIRYQQNESSSHNLRSIFAEKFSKIFLDTTWILIRMHVFWILYKQLSKTNYFIRHFLLTLQWKSKFIKYKYTKHIIILKRI